MYMPLWAVFSRHCDVKTQTLKEESSSRVDCGYFVKKRSKNKLILLTS